MVPAGSQWLLVVLVASQLFSVVLTGSLLLRVLAGSQLFS